MRTQPTIAAHRKPKNRFRQDTAAKLISSSITCEAKDIRSDGGKDLEICDSAEALRESIEDHCESIEDLCESTEDLRESIEDLRECIEDLCESIDDLRESIEDLVKSIEALRAANKDLGIAMMSVTKSATCDAFEDLRQGGGDLCNSDDLSDDTMNSVSKDTLRDVDEGLRDTEEDLLNMPEGGGEMLEELRDAMMLSATKLKRQ